MNAQRSYQRIAGGLLFFSGLLLALGLTFITFWPDMEASLFDSSRTAEESLRSLRCPLVVTGQDEPQIRATFENPVDRPVSFLLRANVAQGGVTLMRRDQEVVELASNETREITWDVDAEQAVFGRVILARVYAFRSFPVPSRQAACGILVLDIPYLSGSQFVTALLVGSLVLLGAGAALWLRKTWPLTGRTRSEAQSGAVLVAVTFGGLALSVVGWWVFGIAVFLFNLIFFGAIMERFFGGNLGGPRVGR